MTLSESKSGLGMISPNITAPHVFTTRHGGVSSGAYSSLNLGINRGDDIFSVRENYKIICRELGITPGDIVCSQQVHGSYIRTVTRADCEKLFDTEPCEADGLITAEPGVALAVFTADCVPILLHDPVHGAVGAVHAGWRGTVLDIAGRAVARMNSEMGCKTRDIRAAIGPCISKCCFETGPEVMEAVCDVLGDSVTNCLKTRFAGLFRQKAGAGTPRARGAESFSDAEPRKNGLNPISRNFRDTLRGFSDTMSRDCFASRGEKYMVDLKETNRLLLVRAGVLPENIAISDECTYCSCEKYWSHRKTDGIRGSQAAIIVMKGNAL